MKKYITNDTACTKLYRMCKPRANTRTFFTKMQINLLIEARKAEKFRLQKGFRPKGYLQSMEMYSWITRASLGLPVASLSSLEMNAITVKTTAGNTVLVNWNNVDYVCPTGNPITEKSIMKYILRDSTEPLVQRRQSKQSRRN